MLTAILPPVLLLILPPAALLIAARRSPRFRRSGARGVGLSLWLLSLLPICAVPMELLATAVSQPSQPYNQLIQLGSAAQLQPLYTRHTVTQAAMHGLTGWEGIDIKSGCGSAIHAPFSGTITYNGRDGYNHIDQRGVVYDQNTMLTLTGSAYTLTLLHGRYPHPVGTAVTAGQIIGYEDSIGWSTGCHSHVILRDATGRTLNYLDAVANAIQQPAKPLKISWYDPALGGINCDHDCTTMASGVRVTPDRYGRTAACIRPWLGRTVTIPGIGTYTCLDTGGAIVETADYIWIDLMHTRETAPTFGQLITNWSIK